MKDKLIELLTKIVHGRKDGIEELADLLIAMQLAPSDKPKKAAK